MAVTTGNTTTANARGTGRSRMGVRLACLLFLSLGANLPSAFAAPGSPAVAPTAAGETSGPIAVTAGKILSVTVMPQGAWVTRQLRLPAAPTRARDLLVLGLPQGLDPANLSLSGGKLRQLAPMQLLPVSAEDTQAVRELDRKIAVLKSEQEKAIDQLDASSVRMSIFMAQMGHLGGKAVGAFVTDPAARKRFDRALNRIVRQRQQARQQRDAIKQQIAGLKKHRAALVARGGKLSIKTRIGPATGSEAQKPDTSLELRYRVKQAGWRPIYTARLSTTEGRVDWTMTAQVHQQTGEDWSAVPLTLATLDNRRYYPVPSLLRWTIGFRQGPVTPPPAPLNSMVLRAKSALGGDLAQAELKSVSDFNAEYHSVGPVTVTSQKTPVVVALGHERLVAKVAVRVAPQVNPLPVLTARFALKNKQPLPAGNLVLFRDGSQVGGRHLAALEPQEKLTLGFGVDHAIDVTYRTEPEKRDEHGLIGKSRELLRKSTVMLVNHHDRSVPVEVLMHLPVATDADIAVEPLAANTPPTQRRFDGIDGVWAWKLEPAAGKQALIHFGFRIRWPKDKHLNGL